MHWLASSSYNIRMRKVLILSVSPHPPSFSFLFISLPPSLLPSLSLSLSLSLSISLSNLLSLFYLEKNYSVFSFLEYPKRKKMFKKKVEISDYRLMLIWYSKSFLHIPAKLNGIKIGNIFKNCINRNTFFLNKKFNILHDILPARN